MPEVAELPPAPRNPTPAPPPRRPGSVRRTSTLLAHWPGGRGTQTRVEGRARDLRTHPDGEAEVLDEHAITAGITWERVIEDIAASPPRPEIIGLVGSRGGSQLRGAIDNAMPDERLAGTPLYLLLDDLAGMSLIAGFAWFPTMWSDPIAMANLPTRYMQGICAGFRPGSSALMPDGNMNRDVLHNVVPVPPLAGTDDPLSWHQLDAAPAVAMRRARRIDVWTTDGVVAVDAMFRDSCWQLDGAEIAVHEYHLDANVDPDSGRVLSLRADPRVLPYRECPAAAPNAERMVGAITRDLRTEVLERLQTTDCCTHLNDALRSLAEVPVLFRQVRSGGRPASR